MWFASKCISLQYHKQLNCNDSSPTSSCDLLPNVYLCNIISNVLHSMIGCHLLWFASKCISLQYHKQLRMNYPYLKYRCDLLPNVYLCNIISNPKSNAKLPTLLWFASKCISLQYHKQPNGFTGRTSKSCDLLPNVYLCNIISNLPVTEVPAVWVVICFQMYIFAIS